MIKVLVLQRKSHVAKGVFSLSVEARITEVLDYLQDNNKLEYIVVSEEDPIVKNAILWCDTMFLSKHSSAFSLTLVEYARKHSITTIYDIDDWIFSFPEYSAAKGDTNKLELIQEIISNCTYVTVANKILLKSVVDYCDNPIYVPNGMYLEKYINYAKNTRNLFARFPRIILTNADMLKVDESKEDFLNALQTFFLKHPEYILDFYGDPFPEMLSMPFLHFTNRVPYAVYIKALINGRYQFSITPLGGAEDKESEFFNSCKNPFKYLNYGVARVPGIYSNASIYNNGTVTRETGILVNNTYKEWLNALEQMSNDSKLRDKIQKNAFEDILNNHHISASAQAFMNLIRKK